MDVDNQVLVQHAKDLAFQAEALAKQAANLVQESQFLGASQASGQVPTITLLTCLVLAAFLGFALAGRRSEESRSPLVLLAGACASVIIVGAIIAGGQAGLTVSKVAGFLAILLASVNLFGGFVAAYRLNREAPEAVPVAEEPVQEGDEE